MNCSSTPSPQRSLSPLFLLAAVSLALAPVGFAQTAAPAAPAVAAPAAPAAPAVIVGTVAATPVPSLSGTDKVGPMVLRDETIGQVLELLQRWTGKTVLRPQALPASLYTLSLPATATRNDALLAIETLLTLNGVAVIQQGDKFLKVVPNNVAKAESPTLLSESTLSLPASGRVASKIFLLKHANGQEVVVQIQGMLNSTLGTAPVFFGRNNAILVTDSIMNLQKIETLLAQLDRPQLDVIATKLYNLKHAMATDMVNKLTALLRTPAAAGASPFRLSTGTSFTADERTNAIVARGVRARLVQLADVIELLDVPAVGGASATGIPGAPAAVTRSVRTVMLRGVTPTEAKARLSAYPHQFSGGMRQRIVIAIALINNPKVLIADEPTTALDVTVQAQILDLIKDLQAEFNMAVILITHDLGVIAESAQNVLVMYAGRIVERSTVNALFSEPTHPYAWGLLGAVNSLETSGRGALATIPGSPPSLIALPSGCSFNPRCAFVSEICTTEVPMLRSMGSQGSVTACHLSGDEIQLQGRKAVAQ